MRRMIAESLVIRMLSLIVDSVRTAYNKKRIMRYGGSAGGKEEQGMVAKILCK